MSRPAMAPEPTPAVLDEAAHWFVLLASGEASAAERARWQAWRVADPQHEAGWQRAEAAAALFGEIPPAQAAAASEVLARRAVVARGRRRALGGLLGVLVVGWGAWQGWRLTDASADYATAVGQWRDLQLADGTRLQLDTDTVVDVDLSSRTRLLRLRRGRILVTTAPATGPALPPLFVQTAEGRVQALGTRFVVQQHPGQTEVAVLEARVALHARAGQGAAPVLAAGQAARFDRQGHVMPRAVSPADGAWSRAMLVLDDQPLAQVVAELARYRQTPLHCDPRIADWRLSGTYPLANIDQALAVIADSLPVQLRPLRAGDPAAGQVLVPVR